jgi:hypothetical protein
MKKDDMEKEKNRKNTREGWRRRKSKIWRRRNLK